MIVDKETKKKIESINNANPYADVTPHILGEGLPLVTYSGFFPGVGEAIVYAAPAYTFKDKEQVVGYTGRSSGASVRVAKGLTIRTGGSGGRAIRDNVRKFYDGDFVLTNKRVLFIGKDDSFEFPLEKVSAIKLLDKESFVIQSGRTAKNIGFDTVVCGYAYSMTVSVIDEVKSGEDLYEALTLNRERATSYEELETQKEVKPEKVSTPKTPTDKKKSKRRTIILIIVALYFVGLAVALIIAKNAGYM